MSRMSETSKEFDRILANTVGRTNDFLNKVRTQEEGLMRLPMGRPITEEDVRDKCRRQYLTSND